MSKAVVLSGEARAAALATLRSWQVVTGRDAIRCVFLFKDFNTAFGFMTRVALAVRKGAMRFNRQAVFACLRSRDSVRGRCR